MVKWALMKKSSLTCFKWTCSWFPHWYISRWPY